MDELPEGTELLELAAREVSMVDRAAIRRKFVRVKRADGTVVTEKVEDLAVERDLDRTFQELETTIASVAKADRKMTRRRREVLYAAKQTLEVLLKELEEPMPDKVEKEKAENEVVPPVVPAPTVDVAALAVTMEQVVTKSLAPLVARLDALEKTQTVVAKAETTPVVPSVTPPTQDVAIAKAIGDAVAASLAPVVTSLTEVQKRLSAVEATPGATPLNTTEKIEKEKAQKGFWGGSFNG